MTFLGAPLATLLSAGAAIAVALTALYLLRPSRRRVAVPYARLWGILVRDARATRAARRLRRWESLLLQLLIASLLLVALADPHFGRAGAAPRHVILIDTSASMQARDRAGGPTRLERARREVEGLLDGLRPDEEAMLVSYDATPRALSSMTRDEASLRAALAQVRPSDAPDAILPALELAADALSGAATPRVTIVSDGGIDPEAATALAGGLPALRGIDVRAIAVGGEARPMEGAPGEADNLAITAFSVRRYPANPSAYEILVEVRSFSDQARKARLTIQQEGEPVETTELELAPRGRVVRRLSDLTGEGRRLVARLETPDRDVLPLDDVAYAVLPDRRKTRVLLVGDGALYAEGALLLDRAIEARRVSTAAYAATSVAEYDLVVFDGYTPTTLPERPALYLGCDPPGCPFQTKGSVEAPIVTEVEREHPVLRWVALKDLNVSRSTVFSPAPTDRSLASSLGRTLLIAGERQGRRVVALGFAPARSDLPLRVAFPVLLVNAIQWLSGRDADDSATVLTGRPQRLAAKGRSVEVRGPDGTRLTLPARDGRVELRPERAGEYLFDDGRVVAANLADPRESQLTTRQLALAGHVLEAPARLGRIVPRAALWRGLAIVALLLVLFEWWTFHRRWTV